MTHAMATDADADQYAALLRVRVGWPMSPGEAATIVRVLLEGLADDDRLVPAEGNECGERDASGFFRCTKLGPHRGERHTTNHPATGISYTWGYVRTDNEVDAAA